MIVMVNCSAIFVALWLFQKSRTNIRWSRRERRDSWKQKKQQCSPMNLLTLI